MHISIWTKRVVIVMIFGAATTLTACTCQQCAEPAAAEAQGSTVNHMCPIGKEPIIANAGTIQYKGETIGFCCPTCSEEFLACPNRSAMPGWRSRAAAKSRAQRTDTRSYGQKRRISRFFCGNLTAT